MCVELFIAEKMQVFGARIQPAASFDIRTNAYQLDMMQSVQHVYKYEIRFIGHTKRDEERDLTRGPSGE